MSQEMLKILQSAVEKNASDIHVVIGKPPMIRVRGEIRPMTEFPVVKAEDAKALIYSFLFEAQRKKFEEKMELDCSFHLPGVARFRVNVLCGRQGIEAVLRVINATIPSFKTLNFTPEMEELAKLPRGLVLVTGPTGSGKSTTLAALIDIINSSRKEHILTIEDPIEFVYEAKECIIRQREVGTSTLSFNNALKSALREDPNVILVGELRDLETISLAITASETGHLVFGTLHTTDAPQTVDRIIDVFPSHQQQQVRIQLASTLRAVVCQTLVPTADGRGRVAAREIMIVTPAISNLIREGKSHMVYGAIETGAKFGMMTLDKSLAELVKAKKVTLDEALIKAKEPDKLKQICSGGAY